MTNDVAIMDSLDWDLFAERYWDRQPVLFTALPAQPFHIDEVFRAAVEGTCPPAPRVMQSNTFFTIGRHQQVEPGEWMPEHADGSLTGYEKRMAAQLSGLRYSLTVHSFHAFHRPQWQREKEFYAGLWERVGLPLTGAITTLFHGSYEHSPVGVHLDRFATFMYALRGRKRMRFWAERPWSDPVSTKLDYEPYLDSSFAVEVEPGQLLYWPNVYYHVGESDLSDPDQPATSVNIGVPRVRHHARYDIEAFLYDTTPESLVLGPTDPSRLPPEPAGLLVPPDRADADLDGRLPPDLVHAVDAFRGRTAEHQVRDRAVLLSLRRWTAAGFEPVPSPAEISPLSDDETVRAVTPILWADSGDSRFCAANGHAARTPLPAEQLARLVTNLRADQPVRVGDSTDDARRLLEALESFGAVSREKPASLTVRSRGRTTA